MQITKRNKEWVKTLNKVSRNQALIRMKLDLRKMIKKEPAHIKHVVIRQGNLHDSIQEMS